MSLLLILFIGEHGKKPSACYNGEGIQVSLVRCDSSPVIVFLVVVFFFWGSQAADKGIDIQANAKKHHLSDQYTSKKETILRLASLERPIFKRHLRALSCLIGESKKQQ